ncbi:MAG: hypothetical protein CMJ45_03260 [Planctomyces sp.]|jgi:hypothetical protein|nr:hypothetical protein [Planctomyces sp.]
MDPLLEEEYLQLASDQPEILCSDAPIAILKESASEAEPTRYLEEFFAAGYTAWLSKKHGRRIRLPKEMIDRAILVLWFRASLLNTSRMMGQTNSDDDLPFFSDEGLY